MYTTAVNDLMLLFLFLMIGVVLRQIIKPLRKLYLPSGLIGGAAALIMGPQVLNLFAMPDTWSSMASPMINIVLTTTLFGIAINKSKMKSYAGAISSNMLSYFSQMLVGILAGVGLQKIWKGLPESWGVMTVFTYWGGHGAATSSGTLFEELGVEGMLSIGLILATLGLIVAMVAGMFWVNVGVRRGWARALDKGGNSRERKNDYVLPEEQKSLGRATIASDSINGLALQMCFVFLSMWLGSVIFGGIAKVIPAAQNIPSLLYGIVGAIIVWFFLTRTHLDKYADKAAVDNIGGVALEICICSATATLNLSFFATYLAPILIHMVIIILLMSLLCMVFVRRWFGKDWFPLALMFFGAGCGSTPSGLALARCVDPDVKTESWEAFGVAQGCFVPCTSVFVAIWPVIAVNNLWILAGIGAAVTIVTILFNELFVRKQR
nr:sodium/glutamate symporter [uncultured Blautia sp.]